jgi:hypothetical protein
MVDVVEKSSVIEDEERRTGRATTGRVRVVTAVAIFFCILAPPALIRPSAQGKLSFDGKLLDDMNAVSPTYVFIGNSMLTSRIDEHVLAARLGERCCFLLSTGGAESAWTHQALKNVVLAAHHRPKKVFIFFRDAYLTQPTYRATDRYWWRIEHLSHEDEPELTRAMTLSRTWQEQLAYRLEGIYPVQKVRDRASAAVSWIAGEVVTPGRVKYGESAGQKYDGLFGLDNLRSIEADDTAFADQDLSEFDFDARIGTSLLPSMIRMAKEAGVDLVFVRVQRRPTIQGPPAQSRELQSYMSGLRAYFAGNGIQFYDFTGDPELTLDHYLDGDHIRPEWKPESTGLFLRRLQKTFE